MMNDQEVYAKSFSIEYTALVLIVLCFVAGAFGGKDQIKQRKLVNPAPRTRIAQHYLSQFVLKDVFDTSQRLVENEGTLLALVELLRSHDVILEADVYGGIEGDSQGNLSKALKRSVSFYRYFLNRGIAADAIRIVAAGTNSETQVELRIRNATDT